MKKIRPGNKFQTFLKEHMVSVNQVALSTGIRYPTVLGIVKGTTRSPHDSTLWPVVNEINERLAKYDLKIASVKRDEEGMYFEVLEVPQNESHLTPDNVLAGGRETHGLLYAELTQHIAESELNKLASLLGVDMDTFLQGLEFLRGSDKEEIEAGIQLMKMFANETDEGKDWLMSVVEARNKRLGKKDGS